MRPEKPEAVQFYVELLVHVLRDTAKFFGFQSSSFLRDISYLEKRAGREGMRFLTITLPKLGKALDKCLAQDTPFVIPPEFSGEAYGLMRVPRFLGTLWRCIFTPCGELKEHDLDHTDVRLYQGCRFGKPERTPQYQVVAVRAVRQICYLAYKLELPYADDMIEDKLLAFEELDASLPECESDVLLTPEARKTLENASLLSSYALRGLNPLKVTPRHGPGAVATGEKPHEKFRFRRVYKQLERVYGFADYFFFNYSHLCDELDRLDDLEEVEESCTKAVLVPKDSRGPRLIAMEPLEIQWIQQGLARRIIEQLESPSNITCGFVNFTDQYVNRDLALKASLSQDFVTLDLTDASDRVSLWLVKRLFNPHVYDCLYACRSGYTLLPNGHCVRLRKFASMGSAVCFPIEALVFWSLAVGSLVDIRTVKDLNGLPPVYVYGDDIILRKQDYETVARVLPQFHLELSRDKCCTGRFFRESCGCDAFRGADVTPIRLHTPWSNGRLSPQTLLSYISYANAFRASAGEYFSTSDYLERSLTRKFKHIPFNERNARYVPGFNRQIRDGEAVAKRNTHLKKRYNKSLQREEYRLPLFAPSTIECAADLNWANLYSTLWGSSDPFGFDTRLPVGTFTIPHIVKLGWTWVGRDDLLAEQEARP